ncbi:MAG: hypothetical protein CSA58_02280 [Micrococcales bacterium]|nr:MAG: hypothetical protein CSA58_02280 [Micrococcales bacterium]
MPDRPRVIAVLLAASPLRLAEVVRSLVVQDTKPDTVIGVCMTSPTGLPPWERHRNAAWRRRHQEATDAEIRDLLSEVCDVQATAPPAAGLRAVVDTAMRALLTASDDTPGRDRPARGVRRWRAREEAQSFEERDWLWIIDDTSTLAPQALTQLLAAADSSDPQPVIVGCKQRTPEGQLLNVGLGATRWGRPLPLVELDELDQAQHDHREQVLAVSRPGMLVRAHVWQELRGADPALRGVVADLDLGRRAWLCGHTVTVAPAAVATRVAPAPGHDAPPPGAPALPPGTRAQLAYQRLVHSPAWALPWVVLTILGGALGRIVLGIAAADPVGGMRNAAASLATLTRFDQVLRGRARLHGHRTGEGARRHAQLLASVRATGRFHRDRWYRSRQADRTHARLSRISPVVLRDRPCANLAVGTPERPLAGRPQPRLGSVVALRREPSGANNWWLSLVLVCFGLVGVIGGTTYWSGGDLTSSALPVVPDSVRTLFAALRSGWVFVGLGQPGPHDPVLAPLAGLSLLSLGNPALLVNLLFLFAPALAAAAGWWLAAALATRTRWRATSATIWAGSPALLTAVSGGRLGAVLAHICLAATAAAFISALGSARRRSASAWYAVAALFLWVCVSASPLLLIPLLLVLVAVAVWVRRVGPWLVPVPALVGLAPLLWEAVAHPRVLVAAPGSPAPAEPFSAWMGLLGWPAGFGPQPAAGLLVCYAAGAVLPLLALLAAPRGAGLARGSATVRWGLAMVLLGCVTAVVAARTAVGWSGSQQSSASVPGWPGPAVSLTVLGMLVMVLATLPRGSGAGLGKAAGVFATSSTRPVALAVATVLGLGCLGGSVGWAWQQRSTPAAGSLTRSGQDLPQGLVAMSTSTDRSRILVLRPTTGEVRAQTGEVLATDVAPGWTLTRFAGPRLDLTSAAATVRAYDSGRNIDTEGLAQAFVDVLTTARTPQEAFGPYAIGGIAVLPGPGADVLTARLTGTAGLYETGEADGIRAWRVRPVSSAAVDAADRPAALRLYTEGTPGWQALRWDGGLRQAQPQTVVPAGPGGRVLEISERFDSRWRAHAGQVELSPVPRGWAQGFQLPSLSQDTMVQVYYRDMWHQVWLVLLGSTLLLTLVVAVPLRGVRG